nr:hypothetical protein [Caloranaerobacter ferrireducens]
MIKPETKKMFWGNKQSKDKVIPLTLNSLMKKATVKPIIKPLRAIIINTTGIPITVMPSSQIAIIVCILFIIEYLKRLKVFKSMSLLIILKNEFK